MTHKVTVLPAGHGAFPDSMKAVVTAEQIDVRIWRMTDVRGWIGYAPSESDVRSLALRFGWQLKITSPSPMPETEE